MGDNVMFIGQTLLKHEVENLIKLQRFPRVFAICGRAGYGKTTAIHFIADSLNISDIIEVVSIDDIRTVIINAPNISHNTILHITSFEGLNFRARETLLKLCEDIPNHLYIAIEVVNVSLFEDRFLNRSQIFRLTPYVGNELVDILKSIAENIDDSTISSILSVTGTPKDFNYILDYGVDIFVAFMDKVLKNICNAQPYNAMKICDNLSTKSDDDKISMQLFFNALRNLSFRRYLNSGDESMLKLFNSSSETYDVLINYPKTNKRAIFDHFILSLREGNV